LTDRVDREPLLRGHRVLEYLELVSPGAELRRREEPDGDPPPPKLSELDGAAEAWRALVEVLSDDPKAPRLPKGREDDRTRPTVGLFPGGNAPSRRWPAERFRELAERLGRDGVSTPVFGGDAERGRTAAVSDGVEGAVDLGGRTSLEALAGGLLACDVLVTNDSGPMHLAAAVGCPVVVPSGPADAVQTRPLGTPARLVGRFDLPCVPCVLNECPRSGEGYVLREAERECMHLITVEEIREAVIELLERPRGHDAEQREG
ncbi:MAG: glycosyltransferase family 9 protein, partial [Gemmatimonadota bacterium]